MEKRKDSKERDSIGSLAEALIDAIAAKTAVLVLERLEGSLRQRWLNYEQAAAYLGMSLTALRQRKEQFPKNCYTTVGKAVRWDANALDKWLVSNKGRRSRLTEE